MKEATGELNTTLVVVISVGVLATFFFTVLWPALKGNFKGQTDCNRAVCNCSDTIRKSNNGKCECRIKGESEPIYCIYKG